MSRKMKLILPILCFVLTFISVQTEDECNKEKLDACFSTMEGITVNMIDAIQKAEKDLNAYCHAMETEGRCISSIAQSCKEKNKEVADLLSILYDYLNIFCTERGKVYMDIAPCFETHKAAFEDCFQKHKKRRDDDDMRDICLQMDSMECLADLSKAKCENGEAFGNSVKQRIKQMESIVCSGAETLASSFMILTVMVFSLIYLKNKSY